MTVPNPEAQELERRVTSAEILSLLEEIKSSEFDAKRIEQQILLALEQIRLESVDRLTKEERAFIRSLIRRHYADVEMRLAIKQRMLVNSTWAALLATFAGLWLLLKDSLS